jgi:D-ribulokinase
VADAWLGLDFGSSGARAVVIDDRDEVLAQGRYEFSGEQSASLWRTALYELIGQIPFTIRRRLAAIALDGTSASVLLCGPDGEALGAPLLYDDARAAAQAATLAAIAPPRHIAASATSGLSKLLWLTEQADAPEATAFLHQADWLAFLLHGQLGASDYHNALKTGCDPESLDYPDWIKQLPAAALLPRIVAPGSSIGPITGRMAHHFALPRECQVRAGTTDSIAAFLATGARKPGEAVTSLGSTLVLKLLSRRRVDNATHGIYSHRLGNCWLAGGASNSGGAVLRTWFDDARLTELSARIDPTQASGLDYYPLNRPGERFPVADPTLQARLSPRPDDDVRFLHGLLEGIARIEADGYRLLERLGATPLSSVLTSGGGAGNPTWNSIRRHALGVPVSAASHAEAAYGAALLAKYGENLLSFGAEEIS